MQAGGHPLLKTVVLLLLAFGLCLTIGVQPAGTTSRSSCVTCHTDEKALIRNLSPVKQQKSALTSGAG